jgi:glyoxylase-like metal-dependent hydrolase (beta-lactamase superfamily II)
MKRRIHQINDPVANIYLIAEPDGLTLIDTGTTRGLNAIRRTFATYGYRPQNLKRILITHCDPDHVGSAAQLKAWTGAKLYASQAEAEALRQGGLSRDIRGNRAVKFLFGLSRFVMPIPPASVDDTRTDGMLLPVLDGLQVIATPGHTPNHVSFFSQAHRVLFAGDSLTATPGGLRSDDSPVTWDYAQARESARTQAELDARMVCCGHGPVLQNDAIIFL